MDISDVYDLDIDDLDMNGELSDFGLIPTSAETEVSDKDITPDSLGIREQLEIGGLYRHCVQRSPESVAALAIQLEENPHSSNRLKMIVEEARDEAYGALVSQSLGQNNPRKWRKDNEPATLARIFRSLLKEAVVSFLPKQVRKFQKMEGTLT